MGDALWGRTWAERCSAGDAEFDSIKFDFETWKTTNQITKRMQIFINKCLIRIMNIKWTDEITNEELWRITNQKSIEIQIKRRK